MTVVEALGFWACFSFTTFAVWQVWCGMARLGDWILSVGWRGAAEAALGGAYLLASAGITVVLAPIAAVFSDKLEEAEEQLAEAVAKPKRPYEEQVGYGHVPGRRLVEVEPGVTTDEEFKRILEEIEAA